MKKKLIIGSLVVVTLSSGLYFHGLSANAAQQISVEKTLIVDKMNNAVDYYGYAKGSYSYKDSKGNVQNVDFEIQEGNNAGSNIVFKDKGKIIKNKVSDKDSVLLLDDVGKTFRKTAKLKGQTFEKPNVPRKQVIDGEAYYSYRKDPSGADEANIVTLPQQFAFWLTDDTSNSTVVGHEILLGRDATVLTGNVPSELKGKGTNFKMSVDSATGILLNFITTDNNGAVIMDIKVSNIELSDAKGKVFDTNNTKGYKDISPKEQFIK